MAHWKSLYYYDISDERAELESPPFTPRTPNGDCNKLVWRNGMAECSIYNTRPELCREFPYIPHSISTLPECTYTFRKEL